MGSRNGRLQPQQNSPPEQERGIASKDEMKEWIALSSFTQLPPRGQEAFFRYLRRNNYSEDQDIVDVCADEGVSEGMNQDSRRYQCWLKCQSTDLTGIYDVYIKQELTRLPQEVNRCFNEFKKRKADEKSKEQEAVRQSQASKEESGSQSQESKEEEKSVSESQKSKDESVSQSQESQESSASGSESRESQENESSVSETITKAQFLKEIKTAVDTVNDVLIQQIKEEAKLNLNTNFKKFIEKLQKDYNKS
ncbi:hypothetical protein Pmani_028924 [Petrolisthes manimaculis]|uniref:Uncharacterized protein n=1 Tax=Petrolisthes manimaculis TaxID=1843537 RepID=A0AAE1TV47_9EUCA|nr:hypothetical protein Pmani_028924 [Petrolisthes manimaculis]